MTEIDDHEVILKEIHRRLPKCPACEMVYDELEFILDSSLQNKLPMLITKGMGLSTIHMEENVIKIRLYFLNTDVDLFAFSDPVQKTIDLIQEKLREGDNRGH